MRKAVFDAVGLDGIVCIPLGLAGVVVVALVGGDAGRGLSLGLWAAAAGLIAGGLLSLVGGKRLIHTGGQAIVVLDDAKDAPRPAREVGRVLLAGGLAACAALIAGQAL